MSASSKSPTSVSPRDIRMENRNNKRDSTGELWTFSGARDSKDLNEDATARNLPGALREVADAAVEYAATASAKTGPNIGFDDLLDSSEEAKEAKEGNEPHDADTVSSEEEDPEDPQEETVIDPPGGDCDRSLGDSTADNRKCT